ncbi:MAG TPA: sulfatase [Planctomycetota bacterium]|nr:sulfatase [Planctomycetota bacterium]
MRSRSLLFLAGLVAVSGVIGCRAREVPGDGSPPGVVLLIIDTLRWDALSPRADGTPRVPSLSRFAAEGVTFTEASATAPWTLPSIASALSGLLPRRHGAQLAFNDAAMRRVPPGVVMLAEVFEANGWSTAACTAGGWVAPELGLGTGFDQFTTNFDLHDPEFFLEPWEAKRPKDRPFFLMLHTGAPHDPYGDKDLPIRLQCRPNPEVKEVARKLVASLDAGQPVDDLLYADFVATRTSDPCSRKAIDLLLGPSRTATLMGPYNQWMAGGWQRAPSANLPTRMRTAYERGLAYVDRRIDHTLKTLDSLGLPKDTVFMVVADHGESFGEHGHLYHGQSMHDAVLKVPFVIRAPKRLPAGRVVRDGCSLVDVMPTLLDLAGLGDVVPAGIDGRSLVPVASGTSAGHAAIAEGEVVGTGSAPLGLVSVRTPQAKWVLAYDLPSGQHRSEEIYDLVTDPDEHAPLPALDTKPFGVEFCRAVDRMRSEIAARYGQMPQPPSCP